MLAVTFKEEGPQLFTRDYVMMVVLLCSSASLMWQDYDLLVYVLFSLSFMAKLICISIGVTCVFLAPHGNSARRNMETYSSAGATTCSSDS